jgi:hypothetical protein
LYKGDPNPSFAQVAVTPNTSALVFINEHGNISAGHRDNDLTATAFGWGNIKADIREAGNLLIWSNGTWWSRDVYNTLGNGNSNRQIADTTWRFAGAPCRVVGPDQNLTFVNEKGQGSAGKLIDAKTVQASGWGITGKLVENRSAILWSNGTVWIR